jgi:hypothetical protein
MSMKVNDDGKFFGRVVAAFAGAAPVLAVGAIIWWRDAGLADSRAAEAIGGIEKRLDRVENDGQEMRRSAAEDRQKTAELAGDVRNVLRSTARIEALLDRWTAAPSPSRP